MNTSSPSPADALFSKARRLTIAALFSAPTKSRHLRALGREIGVSTVMLGKEIGVLAAAGIVLDERDGNRRMVRANPACSIFDELQGIASKMVQSGRWGVFSGDQDIPIETFDSKIEALRYYREHASSDPADPRFNLRVRPIEGASAVPNSVMTSTGPSRELAREQARVRESASREKHFRIAARLASLDPALEAGLNHARGMVQLWKNNNTRSPKYIDGWSNILSGDPVEVAKKILSIDPDWMDAMFQNTPFNLRSL